MEFIIGLVLFLVLGPVVALLWIRWVNFIFDKWGGKWLGW